jgi:hypothetical protein
MKCTDDTKFTNDDIVVLPDTITSWRSEVPSQMTELRVSNSSLEELKMSQEQSVADVDACKILFKSEAGASATDMKEVAAVLREECLSSVRLRSRRRLKSGFLLRTGYEWLQFDSRSTSAGFTYTKIE